LVGVTGIGGAFVAVSSDPPHDDADDEQSGDGEGSGAAERFTS
jgi:hypothetical protein